MRLLILVLVVTLFFCGCLEQKSISFSTFEIVPKDDRNCKYEEGVFSVTVLEQDDEIVDWSVPLLQFKIRPNLETSDYDAEDYCTIFFELIYDSPRIFQMSQGVYQVEWYTGQDTWKLRGSKQFSVMSELNLKLELNLNLNQVLEEGTTELTIRFYNKEEYWKQEYPLIIRGIRV